MGDVIKKKREWGTLWNRNGEKIQKEILLPYVNVNLYIFNTIHLSRNYGPNALYFPIEGTLHNLKNSLWILDSLQFCYRDKI